MCIINIQKIYLLGGKSLMDQLFTKILDIVDISWQSCKDHQSDIYLLIAIVPIIKWFNKIFAFIKKIFIVL